MIQLKKMRQIIDFLDSLTQEERNVLKQIELTEIKISRRGRKNLYTMEQLTKASLLLRQGVRPSQISRQVGINYSTLKHKIKKGLI